MMYVTRVKIVCSFFAIIIINAGMGSSTDTESTCSSKQYDLTDKPCSDCDKPATVGCRDLPIDYRMYEEPFGNGSILKSYIEFYNASLFKAPDFYIILELVKENCPDDNPNCNCVDYSMLNDNCNNKFQGKVYERFGVEYSDIPYGNYCTLITFGDKFDSDKCPIRTELYQFKGVIRNEAVATQPKDDRTRNIFIIVGTVGGVLIVTSIIIILRKQCWKSESIVPPPTISETDSLNQRPVVKIFLIYYNDCNHHSAAVKSFAELLNANNCDVLYDVVDYNQLAINPIGWVSENLTSRNFIIIVNSSGAHQCHDLWLKNKAQQNQDLLENIFLTAIVDLTRNAEIKHDYNKVIHIRFQYTDRSNVLQSVCPGKHYQVPDDWKRLLAHIHGPDIMSENTDTESCKYQRLLHSIGNAETCRCTRKV